MKDWGYTLLRIAIVIAIVLLVRWIVERGRPW